MVGMLVRPSIVVAALLLVVLATYANALEVPFLWDDRSLILDNPDVHHGASLAHYFSRPFWPDPDEARAFFRPLVAISYRLDFALHGENPAGFHLANVAFHVLSTGLLFALLRRWGAALYGSALACAAFALLPRLTEAVTWIAGRTDIMATTGVLTALLLWPMRSNRSVLRRYLSALALLIGLLCKEVALAGVAAIVTLELVQEANRTLRERAIALAPVVAITTGFVALHEHVLGPGATGDGLPGVGARLEAACATWGTYAGMLIAPWRPLLQVGQLDVAPPLAIVVGVVVLAIAVTVFVKRVVRRDAAAAGGLAICITSIALVSHLVPIPTSVLCADRFLYLPAAGLALAAAVSAERLGPRLKQAAAVSCGLWILASATSTFVRNAHMADELGLWIETAERTEISNPLPAIELGNVLFRAGDWDEALRLQTAALAEQERDHKTGSPAWMHAAATAATCLSNLGDYARARILRMRLVELLPTSSRAWLELARVELHELDFDASRIAVLRAEQVADDARDEAAELSTLIADLDRARPTRWPTDTAALVDLAKFEDRAGRRVQAERLWTEVFRRPDVAPPTLGEGAAFLARRGSLEAATVAAQRVLAEPTLARESGEIREVVEQKRRLAARIDTMRGRLRAYEARLR
jgi:protein O-mannosyl-transferase